MGKQWDPGQAKKFAREVELGKTYYTVSEQTARAAIYNGTHTYTEHVFTSRSLVTGQPMTDGRTSALALCRNQGPVYDTPPEQARPRKGSAPQDGLGALDAGATARGWW